MLDLIPLLLWFCNARHCDWLKYLVLLSQQIRSKTNAKTCSDTFPALGVSASSSDWFIGLPVSVVIGQSDYFGFGFGFTTLKVKTTLQQSNCILKHGH